MRRGSVVTYADDATGMASIAPDPASNASMTHRRSEFAINDDISYERTRGIFVSYRTLAFIFVLVLAICIAAAFIVVCSSSSSEPVRHDALALIEEEEKEVPHKNCLSNSIEPLHYQVFLTTSLSQKTGKVKVSGMVEVEFTKNGSEFVNKLVIAAKNLKVSRYQLHSINGTFKEIKIIGNETDDSEGTRIVKLASKIDPGTYMLRVNYETALDGSVIFAENLTKINEKRVLLASKLNPDSAPRLFPIFNSAKLKSHFSLTLTHPNESKVLSNMPLMLPLINSSESEYGMITDRFQSTPLISPHSLAFIEGNFESLGSLEISETSKSISFWGDADKKTQEFYLKDKISSIVSSYSKLFNSIYPFDKLDLVAAPLGADGISAPGLITIRDSSFYCPENGTLSNKIKSIQDALTSVGRQWMGGLVSAENSMDSWFVEGSIKFLQYEILKQIDPSLETLASFLVDVETKTMESDGYEVSKALGSNIDRHRLHAMDLSDIYNKGACLIRMLHAHMSDSEFKKSLASFVHDWQYNSTDSNTFLRTLLEHVTDTEEKGNLNKTATSFISAAGYPIINVTRNYQNGSVHVRQNPFRYYSSESEEEKSEEWYLPLSYATPEVSFSDPKVAWLKGKEQMVLENLTIGEKSWIIFNINRTSYCRVNYDKENWNAIGEVLQTKHDEIPTDTRASLIDDIFSLARIGATNYATAFNFSSYISNNERDYTPWLALSKNLIQLDFALYDTPVYLEFREYVKNLVSPLYKDMEADVHSGSPLAILAVNLACSFEQNHCLNWAEEKWNGEKTSSEVIWRNGGENPLPIPIRKVVYCQAAKLGREEEFSWFLKESRSTSDREEKHRLLSALGCFEAARILKTVLNDMLEDDQFDEFEVRTILWSYASNPPAAEVARKFVQERWNDISKRYSHSYWTMKAFVKASTRLLNTERDLNEFQKFTEEHLDTIKPMAHWIALAETRASSWINTLKSCYGEIQKWLRNNKNS